VAAAADTAVTAVVEAAAVFFTGTAAVVPDLVEAVADLNRIANRVTHANRPAQAVILVAVMEDVVAVHRADTRAAIIMSQNIVVRRMPRQQFQARPTTQIAKTPIGTTASRPSRGRNEIDPHPAIIVRMKVATTGRRIGINNRESFITGRTIAVCT